MTLPDATFAASLWVGVHLILIWLLTMRVVRLRLKLGIGTGYRDNETLERAIRGHGNTTEHVPTLLLGLVLVSLLGTPSLWIHVLGGTLFFARLLHVHGMQVTSKPVPLTRASGNVLTWVITLSISGLLIWKFVEQAMR